MVTRVFRGVAAAGCLLLASTVFAQSPFHPNTLKYRDTGTKPATGRAGDATIQALALRGKDGATEVSVASNGSIDKVQLKFHETTTNYPSSGSSFSTRLTGLARGESVDVLANISGADAARTGVVAATPTVKMRPELAMQYVSAPPHALAGTPVHIAADVGEQWGDTGARTTCVLLRDGVEIDRAQDIWIDANGIVACEFATVFPPGSGTVNLRVSLTGTVPADYDTSNDTSRPFSIKVYDRMEQMEMWHASGVDIESSSHFYFRSAYGENESGSTGQTTDTLFHAIFRTTQPNIDTVRASMRVATDDRPIIDVHDVWFDYQPPIDWGWYKQQCALAYLDERDSFIRSCHINSMMDGDLTTFTYSLRSGDVTYLSRGWYAMYAGGPPAYVWYSNYRDVYGSGYRLGDTLSFDIQLSDGTNYWAAHPSMALTTINYNYEAPLTCYGEAPNENCSSSSTSFKRKEGFLSGGVQ